MSQEIIKFQFWLYSLEKLNNQMIYLYFMLQKNYIMTFGNGDKEKISIKIDPSGKMINSTRNITL